MRFDAELLGRRGQSESLTKPHGGLGNRWGQRAKRLGVPGPFYYSHAIGQVVGDTEWKVGDMKAVMAPTPRGAEGKGAERTGTKSWMKRRDQQYRAKGSHESSRQWTTRAHHVSHDHFVRGTVGIIGGSEEPIASVVASRTDDSSSPCWLTDEHRTPCQQRPGVGAKRRESFAVTRGQFSARGAIVLALEPPPAPRRAGPMGYDDLGVVTHEPTSIEESPHKVHVFAHAQRLIKSFAKGFTAHHQTRARHETDRTTRHDEATTVTHVQGTEVLFEPVSKRRVLGATYARRQHGDEGIGEGHLEPSRDVGRVRHRHVRVHEPQKFSCGSYGSDVSGVCRSLVVIKTKKGGAKILGASGDLVGVRGAVVNDGDVKPH